jgi:PncC family amidohydrolase
MPARQYELAAEEAASRLIGRLAAGGLTLGLAESCTGGRVASAITAVSGASAVFLGAVVAYANSVKQRVLGVEARIIEEHGAVSEQCAQAMSRGARKALGGDWAIAVTGIAGPGGGSAEKPVGLVYFAWAGPEAASQSARQHFSGTREEVQLQAVCFALGGLEALLG